MRQMLIALGKGSLVGLILAGVFAAGFWTHGQLTNTAVTILSPVNAQPTYPLLAQVQDLLNQHYLRQQPSQTDLEYGAVRGLLSTLQDKYTFFIDPPVAKSEANVLAGKYGGIGVLVKRNEAARYVLYPFRDSPASRAGIKDGDIILEINDQPVTDEMRPDVVDQAMRGEVKDDNGVHLKILRLPAQQELTFAIKFEEIEIPSVVWRVLSENSAFGYIQILRFTNRTPTELSTAIKELQGQPIHGLILDLRDNPGGLLQESVQAVGQFLEGGVILYQRSRDQETPYEVAQGSQLTKLPMIVLINHNTASAAEVVAGALQDYRRGLLLGQTSYGKGSIQYIYPLLDASSIHITTAEWLTPNRRQIDNVGLTPDIPMIPDANGRDVELGEAILRLSQMVPVTTAPTPTQSNLSVPVTSAWF